ncbi:MAG: hypothetical protein AAGD38_06035 [Acidobacteriota bacterium]
MTRGTAVLLLAGLCLISWPAAATSPCRELATDLGSVYDGTWTDGGDVLILAEDSRQRLARFDLRATDITLEAIVPVPDLDRLIAIEPFENGYWLNAGVYHWIELDKTFTPRSSLDLLFSVSLFGPQSDLVQLVPREVVPFGDRLVGLGHVRRRGEEHAALALFGFQARPPIEDVRVFELIPSLGQENEYVSFTYPLVARTGDEVFALRLGEPPRIDRLVPRHEALTAFPPGFERLTDVPQTTGDAEGWTVKERWLETTVSPSGLYARGEHLYVLTRRPSESSADPGSRWHVHAIDPERDRLGHAVILPTRAAKIALVPGPKHWALLELGPLEPPTLHRDTRVVLIPAAWIEDPASTALATDVHCAR